MPPLIMDINPNLTPALLGHDLKTPPNDVRYVVSCISDDGDIIKNFEQDTPFDALKVHTDINIPSKYSAGNDEPIFKVITTIKGVHPQIQQPIEKPPAETSLSDIQIHTIRPKQIVIYSKLLIHLLRSVVPFYPRQALSGSPITITEPYPALLHFVEPLKECYRALGSDEYGVVETADRRQSRRHLQLLSEYLEPTIQKVLIPMQEKLELPRPVTTFDSLWFLFKPGTRIYVEDRIRTVDEVLTAIVLDVYDETEGGYSDQVHRRGVEKRGFRLDYFVMESDGRQVGRVEDEDDYSLVIALFEGEKEITALPAYPCDFWDRKDNGQRRLSMVERGRWYYNLLRAGPSYVECTGAAFSNRKIRYDKAKVVVDIVSAVTYGDTEEDGDLRNCTFLNPPMNGKDDPWASFDGITIRDTVALTDEQYMLMVPFIPGFVLKEKHWRLLNVNDLILCEKDPHALEDVVFGKTDGILLRALFEEEALLWKGDLIERKGEGQTILLHGPPGVGKTYTVECLAQANNRPLLTLTVADIGLDEDSVESNLATWFALAELWKAVLLIDEADVFLEQRHINDLKRNGLVSVFLRQLEYFRGLIFLTTNRTGNMDDAVVSRIALIIGYHDLDDQKRRDVWQAFFTKLKADMAVRAKEPTRIEPIIEISPYAESYIFEDKEVQKVEWNGREIRNALQTAISLARYRAKSNTSDKIMVSVQDFKDVVNMSRLFQEYMYNTTGRDRKARRMARKD